MRGRPIAYRRPALPALWLALLLFGACHIRKNIREGDYLLRKVDIKTEATKVNIEEDDLRSILKQRPNKRILMVIPFHLWIYNRASRLKEGKVKHYLQDKVGEMPVYYNKYLTEQSSVQLSRFMAHKGYFNAVIRDTVIYNQRKRTARVQYIINAHEPYVISRVSLVTDDVEHLLQTVKTCMATTLVRKGQNYDVDVLTEERERFSKAMKNLGYYKFSREYVQFVVDSTVGNHKISLRELIKDPVQMLTINGKDTVLPARHEKFTIRNIYINPEYKALDYDNDSIFSIDVIEGNDYTWLKQSRLKIKRSVLKKSIYLKKGMLYSLKRVEYTHRMLAALKMFKFININLVEVHDSIGQNQLDCYINLWPSRSKSLSFDAQGTNRGGNLGVQFNMSFTHKNAFKGAERFELGIVGGLEAQKSSETNGSSSAKTDGLISGISNQVEKVNPFNTILVSPYVKLHLPRLWLPASRGKLKNVYQPVTTLNLAYQYQLLKDNYARHIGDIGMTYSWRSNNTNTHSFSPFNLSIIRIDPDSSFTARLEALNSLVLINSYKDHITAAPKYGFTFNNNTGHQRNYTWINAEVEAGGFLARALSPSFGLKKEGDQYLIDLIPYAQFIRLSTEFKRYVFLNDKDKFVYRFFGGIGIPFENLPDLPFEKSFWSGGANGQRAWVARTVGPGGYVRRSAIDQIGDIQLEGNLEYRFDLIGFLDMALFADAGNVWLINKDPNRPAAQFNFSDFYREIYLGTGAGLRFDFSFLILRLDAALQIHDPSKISGERWLWQPKDHYNQVDMDYYQDQLNVLYNTYELSPASPNSDKPQDIRDLEDFISKGKYGYRPVVTFNLGIGYPF